MYTLQIEVTDETYALLAQLAQENETEPTALLHMQIEQLVATYRGPGLTKDIKPHLLDSMQQHRSLLKRLAE